MTLETPFAQSLKNSGQISLHLFFEKSSDIDCPIIEMPLLLDSFNNYDLRDIEKFEPITRYYPINPARNIARKGIKTELFISGDIEQIYVQNFERRMFQLAERILLE